MPDMIAVARNDPRLESNIRCIAETATTIRNILPN